MNRKLLGGIGAVAIVVAALVLVGAGGYRAGERHAVGLDLTGVEVRGDVVHGESASRTIIVDSRGWNRGPGFFPGFVVVPLIFVGIVLLVGSRRRGWCGARVSGDFGGELDAWHRRAHTGDARSTEPTDDR